MTLLAERTEYQEAVRGNIRAGAVINGSFLTMNALATFIACYGLLEDSTAVVIGAMVVATLLGPISGIALALIDGDGRLLCQALLAEAGGMILVLSLALVIGVVHRDAPLTHEMISRTSPALYDLIIALAGGAAGAYASASPRLSTGLVGVAIATALVPPLSVCGLCLGRGETSLGLGALLLFVTNLVAIQFASSIVLWLCGCSTPSSRTRPGSVLLRNGPSLFIMSALGIALTLHSYQTFTRHLFEVKARAKLAQALRGDPAAELSDVRFDWKTGRILVTAQVKSNSYLGPDKVAQLERVLPDSGGAKVELVVHTTLTGRANRQGYLHEPSQPDRSLREATGE
jgi:uncharacterized hydrophobic protein (TIGR00271 family)